MPSATRYAFFDWKLNPTLARLKNAAWWSFLGGLITHGSTVLTALVVAQLLGKRQFGEFAMLQSTAGMLGVFAGLGLGLTATKHVAEWRQTQPGRAGRVIALSQCTALVAGGLLGLAHYVGAGALAAGGLHAPHLEPELRLASLLLVANAMIGTQTGVLAGLEAFSQLAYLGLIRAALTLALTVAWARPWGLRGAVWGLTIASLLSGVMLLVYVRRECISARVPVVYRTALQERSVLWRFSLPALLSSMLLAPVNWATNLMLAQQPNGYAELGLYHAAEQWRNVILFVPAVMGNASLSLLANLRGQARGREYQHLFVTILRAMAGVTTAAAVAITLASPWLMRAYGPGFEQAAPVLAILAAAAVLSAVCAPVGHVIASSGEMWWGLGVNLPWAAALLGAAALLAERGARGLAIANVAAYSVQLLAVGLYWSRRGRWTPPVPVTAATGSI